MSPSGSTPSSTPASSGGPSPRVPVAVAARAAGWAALAGAVLLLGACQKADTAATPAPVAVTRPADKSAFNGIDITGAAYAQDFALSDPGGAKRTLADYRGKVVVVFFGYTHCPDVCPTALVDMAEVRKKLGDDAAKLQVVFITVDPERDTPDTLGKYVPAFDPSFVGLSGTPEQVAQAAREFKVFYQKVPSGGDKMSYNVDHTAGRYVFDPQGRIRLLLKPDVPVDGVVADVRRLIAQAS